MPYLEVLNGPEVGEKVEISAETFFIGRDPNNHLTLSDRTVSRKHAVINLIEGKYVLSDLKSLKGVLINGVKKEEAHLEFGDEIAVGAVRIRFHPETKPLAISQVRNRKIPKVLISLLLFLLLVGGGLWLWFSKAPSLNRAPNLVELQMEYERGLELFNEYHDRQGAKEAWRNVLAKDPKQETPFAKKAAKLLENLE